jgi:hypothetical protein
VKKMGRETGFEPASPLIKSTTCASPARLLPELRSYLSCGGLPGEPLCHLPKILLCFVRAHVVNHLLHIALRGPDCYQPERTGDFRCSHRLGVPRIQFQESTACCPNRGRFVVGTGFAF